MPNAQRDLTKGFDLLNTFCQGAKAWKPQEQRNLLQNISETFP